MLRHLSTVLISAVVGSLLGTVALLAVQGSTASPNPAQFLLGFGGATLVFTIPGAVLLMAATFRLAARPVRKSTAAVLLIIMGTVVGALMLSFTEQRFAPVGALFGSLTAFAFVSTLFGLRAYPLVRR